MPHFALGVDAYVQATSPLRRYADLVAHHQIKAHLRHEELPIGGDELVALMGHLEVITTAAARIERARTQYWQLVYLSMHLEEQFDALLLELNEHKAGTGTVLLPGIALRTRCGFKARLAPGDMLRVKVLSVHPRRDELRLQHVSETP